MARKTKDTPHLRLRIDAALLARLEKSAEKNERTLTGEITHRLEASFKRDEIHGYLEVQAQVFTDHLMNPFYRRCSDRHLSCLSPPPAVQGERDRTPHNQRMETPDERFNPRTITGPFRHHP